MKLQKLDTQVDEPGPQYGSAGAALVGVRAQIVVLEKEEKAVRAQIARGEADAFVAGKKPIRAADLEAGLSDVKERIARAHAIEDDLAPRALVEVFLAIDAARDSSYRAFCEANAHANELRIAADEMEHKYHEAAAAHKQATVVANERSLHHELRLAHYNKFVAVHGRLSD
jgi:hypothetical protein